MTACAPRSGRPLDVLVVTPKGVLGGAERWLLSLLDNTDRIRAHVVMLGAGPLESRLRERGVGCTVLSVGAGGAEIVAAIRAVRRVLRRRRPDVVLANGIKAALVSVPGGQLDGFPVVWVKHDPTHERPLGVLVARGCSTVVGVSDSELAPIRKHARRAVVVPPAVGRSSQPSDSGGQRVGVPSRTEPDSLRLLMVGRLVPNKGMDTAIRALESAQGWRLLVVGGCDPAFPAERGRLEALAARVGVADRVHVLGEAADATPYFSEAHAVAALSRPGGKGLPAREGFGLVPVEAALAGLPVLADARFVPSATMIGHGLCPVDARSPESVARALHMLTNSSLRRSIGEAAREAATALPSPEQIADQLVDELSLAARRPGAGRDVGPPFSVAMTVFNEGPAIQPAVRQLLAQLSVDERADHSEPGDEIVIVDGGSTDETWSSLSELARDMPQLRIIRRPGAGISAGRNAAIDAARNEWVACTDAGCEPVSGWLDAFRRAAATGGRDLLTGLYEVVGDPATPWQRAMAFAGYPEVAEFRHPSLLASAYTRVFGLRFDVDLPTGRSVAFTKRAWRAAGGYPEHLPTAEDVVFGRNAVTAGARPAFVSDAVVHWEQRGSLADTVRMYFGYGRGDGKSGSAALIVRDLARFLAYSGGLVLVTRQGISRRLALAGAAAYFSLPVSRARSAHAPVVVISLIPVVMALKDLAKAAGCGRGVLDRL